MTREDQHTDAWIDETANVASATECTGLMPALPRDDAAEANSAALCAVQAAKGARGRRFRKK